MEADKTYLEFAREKERLFYRWHMSERNCHKFQQFEIIMLLEEVKNCLHQSI